ncbi:pilus assembly protein TadG-related protein [Fontivita pretiosa]|uniref:pilus assembly protein TadG-related protein n=1 Tax=Fontivita pretiosa TaxID=2989684 RepID=UPI003D16945B
MAVIYLMFCLLVLVGLCSLAVDYGRVQLAKTELRAAADSAARAAAANIPNDSVSARQVGRSYATLNRADGRPVELDVSNDLKIGRWDPATRSFSELGGWQLSSANAVQVIARRSGARANALPMMFASLLGFDSIDVSAESIAMVIPAISVDQNVLATGNPFLAGMPPGSVASRNNPHNSPDYAGTSGNPRQSPQLVLSLPLVEGQVLSFDSISGTARHDPNLPYYQPDGQLDDVGRNTNGNENGIADTRCPINALVGVFLTDERPDRTAAPPNLDFSTADKRNFTRLEPQCKQIFFIGDGRRDDGMPQQFVVPRGATRLYLATWDFYEWNNNFGQRRVRIERSMKIITVK